jgi:capsular polysaccharide transport system permease protein
MREELIQIRLKPRLKLPNALRTIVALVLREMATSYGRSPGGYIWAIAEPVAGIALLTFVFSMGFHAPPIGTSFAVFYASGLLPFLMYSDLSTKISQSINFSMPLLSYPRVTLADAVIARAVLNALTQVLVWCVIFIGLRLIYDTQSLVDYGALVTAMGCALLLGFGVGTMNCFLVTRFPVWQRIWSILNRPMFILSCVVFTFETTPQPFRDWLWFNPVVHVVGMARQGMFSGYDAAYVSHAYVVFFSLMFGALGFFLIWCFRDRLLNQ